MQSPFVNIMQCPRNTVAGSKARVDEGVIAPPLPCIDNHAIGGGSSLPFDNVSRSCNVAG